MERNQDRIEMSSYERDVLKIMEPVLRGQRTQAEAARLLELSERQVRRIQRRLESEADAGIVHRLRGEASNHRLDEGLVGGGPGIGERRGGVKTRPSAGGAGHGEGFPEGHENRHHRSGKHDLSLGGTTALSIYEEKNRRSTA
jgi:hypothetical protein